MALVAGNPEGLKRKDRLRGLIPRVLKDLLLAALTNDRVGKAVGWAFHDRIPCRGARIATSSRFVTARTKAEILFGVYERAEIDQALAYIAPGADALELGGSIGVNSVQIAGRLGPRDRLIVVEANPELCELARENLARNRREVRAVVVQAAVSYEGDGAALAYEVREDSLRGAIASTANAPTQLPAQAVTLRELVDRFALSDFFLISDIEGGEAGLILMDREALQRAKRVIVELDPGRHAGRLISIEEQVALMVEAGFRLEHRHGNRFVFDRLATVVRSTE